MEAETQALVSSLQESIWLQNLLSEMGETPSTPILYEDNQACIKFMNNETCHGRAKHVEMKFHFARDIFRRKLVMLKYCKSSEMIADIFTKSLPGPLHTKHTKSLQLVDISERGVL